MHGSTAASTAEPPTKIGRRAAARLRLSIPAKLMTIYETQTVILLDLSRTGAQIGLARPLEVGDGGFLRFADFELFGCALRKGQGVNGLEFDMPLSDSQVLAVRRFADSLEWHDRQTLRRRARAWVTGGR